MYTYLAFIVIDVYFYDLGSLHHSQYCDKLKKVVEFAGSKLGLDELSTIWSMQSGKHATVIENIHMIITSASQNFSTDQMEHLIKLLEKVISVDYFPKSYLKYYIGSIYWTEPYIAIFFCVQHLRYV